MVNIITILILPYLTLPSHLYAPVQCWGRISSAQCAAPNVTEGHISLLVVLANRIRDITINDYNFIIKTDVSSYPIPRCQIQDIYQL